jgi:hypothetical protein
VASQIRLRSEAGVLLLARSSRLRLFSRSRPFFVPEGRILGLTPLKRRIDTLNPDGSFTAARFQCRDPQVSFLNAKSWRWDFPPLAGTRELSGVAWLMQYLGRITEAQLITGLAASGAGEVEAACFAKALVAFRFR